MVTTAKEFLAACQAGLILVGQSEEGWPEWLGEDKKWRYYKEILENYERKS